MIIGNNTRVAVFVSFKVPLSHELAVRSFRVEGSAFGVVLSLLFLVIYIDQVDVSGGHFGGPEFFVDDSSSLPETSNVAGADVTVTIRVLNSFGLDLSHQLLDSLSLSECFLLNLPEL